jgi:hypothetical protein
MVKVAVLVVMEAEAGEESAAAALVRSTLLPGLWEPGGAAELEAEAGSKRCVTIDGSSHGEHHRSSGPTPLEKTCELLEEGSSSQYLDVVA